MSVVHYKNDASPTCRAVNMVVDIIGLKTENKIINLGAREQYRPDFLEKNPLHTVPVIEDGDFVLIDSHAIITYLVSKYGTDKAEELYPSDLKTRATIQQILFFDAATVSPLQRVLIHSIFLGKCKNLTKEQKDSVEELYGVLEKFLQKNGGFLAASHLTVADISVVANVSTGEIVVPIDSKFEKLSYWFDFLKRQDWYKTGNKPGLSMLQNYAKKVMSY